MLETLLLLLFFYSGRNSALMDGKNISLISPPTSLCQMVLMTYAPNRTGPFFVSILSLKLKCVPLHLPPNNTSSSTGEGNSGITGDC